ncbi:MAG: HAD-IC family P-type ATPase [Rhodospirillales bacterium]|nr:HAD-IC family P-type ATPase [Rhodospirillales bacterium]
MHPEQIASTLWHARSAAESLALLEAGADGLSTAEADARRAEFGRNVLPRPKPRGVLLVYFTQFKSPLIYLLLAAAVVSVIIGEFTDAAFVFAVLQINAVIGTIQEWKAESSAEALQALIHHQVVARRDGVNQAIDSDDLVPGDIIALESGALVPADARLLKENDVKVDESLLTGESVPVGRDAEIRLAEQTVVGDRRTMLHAGTTVLSGRAEAVVTQTGLHTEVGRIAQALAGTRTAPTPFVVRLERFTRVVGFVVIAAVAVLAAALYAKGMAVAEIFFLCVALAVSAIPEGLPVAITVALTVASARMAKRNVIVRRLPAVEGLGACTIIASDKTGTLTCNELTINRLWLPQIGNVLVHGRGYLPEGEMEIDGSAPDENAAAAIKRIATAGALANEATLRFENGQLHHFGDTVDVAFLTLAGKNALDRPTLLDRFPEIGAVPYESARRYAATFNRDGEGILAHVKGAAEKILPMCDWIDRDVMLAEADKMAADGLRVLAVAVGEVDGVMTPEAAEGRLNGLTFLGFAGLMDPLREEVPDAVDRCRRAGIAVRMVTGDHPVTALAIAKQLQLAEGPSHVVEGVALQDLQTDPAEQDLAIAGASVFARVEPVQKLDIVRSLQKQGHFVAVTGDGVNDAPALHTANIGVAMGKGGTDVARGASDLILADDNFASIVNGVEEGRIAYDNIRKVIYLLISTGAAEIVLFMLCFLFGLPLPLFAVQLLWLNLVTNGIQHVALAFEKGEPGILDQPPRPPNQPIFDRRMTEQVLLSGAFIGVVGFVFFRWGMSQGWSEFGARNALLLLMVCFENAHVFNCRSEWRSVFRLRVFSNPMLMVAVVAAQGVHLGAMFVPGLRDVLDIQPISFEGWIEVAALSVALVAVMEIFKFLRPRRRG